MDKLTQDEKNIIAQALMDYQEGIEDAAADIEVDVEKLDSIITSVEKKLELP